ncbi:TadE/TadG family type IV pilus assembly protein [Sporomusa malonica]|uniref:TadE-like protein n=1 Tax=Sporomusa malonica TaxID=112901 RepID=A0A1W2BGD7_9FIRM|nr:TadE/TadG family type IV pilus assembly protein [Sporomusa malonica]SMC71812.1 TadE-like protein [Sporomusa malonica]
MNTIYYLKQKRGQAMVETALVLPVVVLILFAILEFGLVMNQYLVLTAAAREGARIAAVSDDAAARTVVNDAVASIGSAGLQVNIAYPGGKREQGKSVTVTVSKPVEVTTPVIKDIIDSAFAPDAPVLTGRSVMRVELP